MSWWTAIVAGSPVRCSTLTPWLVPRRSWSSCTGARIFTSTWFTLYILSTENLKRPQEELTALIEIISGLVTQLQDEALCRIQPVGARTFGSRLREQVECIAESTADNPGPHLNIAVGYGGRQ